MVKIKEKLDVIDNKAGENSSEKILEEVSERASKERNVVLHQCTESNATTPEEAAQDDLIGIQSLFNEIGLREMVKRLPEMTYQMRFYQWMVMNL